MGERNEYAPGTFCWVDLGTVDPGEAKAFYVDLFGWDAVDIALPDGGTYTTFFLDGRDVAALHGPVAGPPAWLSYISVTDVDAIAEQARAAGANSVQGPFDVFDAGRMAVIEDPTGAHVAAWQPQRIIGARLVNVAAALCLNQLNTSDPARAERFYRDVFGWAIEQVATGDQEYWGISNEGRLNGGMMPLPPGAGAPSHWLAYFATDGLDAAATRAGELGGQVVVPPMPVPGGRIAVALDPHGAVFALLEGRLDP